MTGSDIWNGGHRNLKLGRVVGHVLAAAGTRNEGTVGPGKVVVLTARGGTGQGPALQLGEAERGGHILHGRTGPADIAEVLRWLIRFAVCIGDGEVGRARSRAACPMIICCYCDL